MMMIMMKNTNFKVFLDGLTNFISPIILWSRYYYFSHFADKEIEAQREFKKLSQIMELGRGSTNTQTQAICALNALL